MHRLDKQQLLRLKKKFGGCLLKLDVAAWSAVQVLTKDQDGQGCKMEEKPRQHG